MSFKNLNFCILDQSIQKSTSMIMKITAYIYNLCIRYFFRFLCILKRIRYVKHLFRPSEIVKAASPKDTQWFSNWLCNWRCGIVKIFQIANANKVYFARIDGKHYFGNATVRQLFCRYVAVGCMIPEHDKVNH